jgi:hypothetical protein
MAIDGTSHDPDTGHVFVKHQANLPSGGHVAEIEIGVFLNQGHGPEHQELLRLIGTLVEEAPPGKRSAENSVEGTVKRKSAASAIETRTGALMRPGSDADEFDRLPRLGTSRNINRGERTGGLRAENPSGFNRMLRMPPQRIAASRDLHWVPRGRCRSRQGSRPTTHDPPRAIPTALGSGVHLRLPAPSA